MQSKYEIDVVQRKVLIEDETAFEEYIKRDFDELVDDFASSKEFTAHLFKVFYEKFWNYLNTVMFGADAYRAYKTQKEYLKTKIVKPCDVGVEALFRRIYVLTNLLLFSLSDRQ